MEDGARKSSGLDFKFGALNRGLEVRRRMRGMLVFKKVEQNEHSKSDSMTRSG